MTEQHETHQIMGVMSGASEGSHCKGIKEDKTDLQLLPEYSIRYIFK